MTRIQSVYDELFLFINGIKRHYISHKNDQIITNSTHKLFEFKDEMGFLETFKVKFDDKNVGIIIKVDDVVIFDSTPYIMETDDDYSLFLLLNEYDDINDIYVLSAFENIAYRESIGIYLYSTSTFTLNSWSVGLNKVYNKKAFAESLNAIKKGEIKFD